MNAVFLSLRIAQGDVVLLVFFVVAFFPFQIQKSIYDYLLTFTFYCNYFVRLLLKIGPFFISCVDMDGIMITITFGLTNTNIRK